MGETKVELATALREQTDESLRTERDTADSRVAHRVEAIESKADAVVRIARERADQIVESARAGDDLQRHPDVSAAEASERERALADLALAHERATADLVLELERTKAKRVTAETLAAEREATDEDLSGERALLDHAVAARDEFLATVSHDLRSLLGGLSLGSHLMKEYAPQGPAGEKIRAQAVRSDRLIGRMERLVNDLLDVVSLEAGKLAIVPERIELAKLLRDNLEAMAPLAAEKGIELSIDAPALPIHAHLDGGRILQVLGNLLGNAIKFTPPKGSVSLRVRASNHDLHFAVHDTGIGIAADALETVFERFRRLGEDRSGLGLGLHISRNIVEAHGGRMWVESELGRGSTFHVSMPLGSPL